MQNEKTGARIWTYALADVWGMAGLLLCDCVTWAIDSVFTSVVCFSNTTKYLKQIHILDIDIYKKLNYETKEKIF
jgi:hypothetical protein